MAAHVSVTGNLAKVATLVMALMVIVSCSKNDNGPTAPEISPAELMAGTYDCSFRLTAGTTWGSPETVLIVRDDGSVRFDGEEILKPTLTEHTLSWSTLDGNPHNATLRFYKKGSDSTYWSDHPKVDNKNFSGVFNRPRDSQFDLRALEEPKPVPLDN